MDSIQSILYVTITLLAIGTLLAFSPTIILTEVAVLTKSKKPFIYSVFLIAGVATPMILLGLVSVMFIDTTARITIPQSKQILNILPTLDIIIGALFIFAGIQLSKVRTKTSEHKVSADELIFSNRKLYWFGCIKTATRLSGLVAIVMAAQLIKQNLQGSISTFLSVAWLVVVAISPLVILVILEQRNSKYFLKISRYSDKAASLSWRKILSILFIAMGIFMIVYGLFFA